MDRNVNKYFTTKNIIFFIMIVLFLIFLNHTIEIALMFFAASIISAALIPFVDKLSLKMPRIFATLTILFTGIIITFLIIIPLVVFSVKQGISVIHNLPSIIKDIHSHLSQTKIFGYDISSMLSLDNITPYLESVGAKVIGKSVSITKVIINSTVAFVTVSLMVFYICYDKLLINEWFKKLFPDKAKPKAENILDSITKRTGGFVIAQFVAMVFVGVLTTIGLLILKNPNAVILGFITGVFDIVPVVGPTVAIIIGLLTAINGHFGYFLATLLVYLIVQVLENQFLRPIIYGKFMNVHPLVIILSLLVGAKFLGFWGVVLGPAISSVICVLIDELYIKPINGEDVNSDNKE